MSESWPRIERFDLEGVVRLTPRVFADARGAFSETYSRSSFADAIGAVDFVQDNVSRSHKRGTVRGLHFQSPPMAQAKLVRVLKGAILDVAVDVRKGSPTYGQHVSVELSAEGGAQLFVPKGFLHGFCTLEDYTEVLYKVDTPYSPAHDGAVFWADPELAIRWPISGEEAVLSEKDAKARPLHEVAAQLEAF
jgi:dTDP-4-dehydrorhamnose 3,5-epimerase